MKLDRLKFAKLVGFITSQVGSMTDWVIEDLDNMINIEMPTPMQLANDKVSCDDIDELLRQLNNPDGFIPAIKAYRVLTGAGLKESKEAIERYRMISKFPKKDVIGDPNAATLGDILHASGRTKAGNNIG